MPGHNGKSPWLPKAYCGKDPFPEGTGVTAKNNPEESAREDRDLRKKIAFLEGKVACLGTPCPMIHTAPDKVSKKKIRCHLQARQ